jgi:hypothetical protein
MFLAFLLYLFKIIILDLGRKEMQKLLNFILNKHPILTIP